ncbi:ABC transporter ATP-binding protein [Nostoc sp.]|uniref:ABC transporter ATP-binding protein n=1 Tax=Nostoc sp. TaxID=1180 RepID=UPI002FF90CD6
MNQKIEEWISEIEELVEHDNLDQAIKRLIDFTVEFSTDGWKWKNQARVLSGTYTSLREEIRIWTKTPELISRERGLRKEILDCLHELADENDEKLSRLRENHLSKVESESQTQSPSIALSSNDISLVSNKYYKTDREISIQGQKQPKLDEKIVFNGQNISRSYESESIQFSLKSITLQLKLGEITAVVGENGSGKTTLLEIVAGKFAVNSGMIEYPYLAFSTQNADQYSIQQQIAYIPPVLKAWPGRLEDMLYFVAASHGKRGQEIVNSVNLIISRLSLEKYRHASWNELSSGFKTRFTLAKMLIRHPKLVVLDEPLANLDINAQVLFLQDLKNLTSSITYPMAVIVSSQHLHRIEDVADNIIFLKNGQAIYNGKVSLFGEDRKENLFEFGCNLGRKHLIYLLEKEKVEYLKLEGDSQYFIIFTS